jgi:hypothetical protein
MCDGWKLGVIIKPESWWWWTLLLLPSHGIYLILEKSPMKNALTLYTNSIQIILLNIIKMKKIMFQEFIT